MPANDKHVWVTLYPLSRANEELAALGGVPDAPLDSDTWIHRHLRICPKEFAYEDWSSYQPAIQKIRLLSHEQFEQTRQTERRASDDVC